MRLKIREGNIHKVPKFLKNHSKEYLYPHDFGGWVEQRYIDRDIKFYESRGVGFEKNLNEWIEKIKIKS